MFWTVPSRYSDVFLPYLKDKQRTMKGQFDYTGFYKSHYASAVFFACRYTANEDDARDIVGEAFLQLLELGDRLDAEKNVCSLLFSIVHNRCMDYLRRLKCYSHAENHIKLTADRISDDELTALCQKELFRIVGKTLAKMSEADRKVFCEIRLDGKSYKEAAQKRNVTTRCVEYQLKKVVGKLRERILKMYG